MKAGQILNEQFELLALVGEGAFGEVWQARQLTLDRIVAIKLIKAYNLDESHRKRFEREALIVGKLSHRNILAVYGIGIWNDCPYMVMEYVEGLTLAQRLQDRELLTLGETVDIAKQIAEGLGAANGLGVVHRDLKPDNILLVESKEGTTAKIIDFGLAKMTRTDQDAQGITEAGMTVGTVSYMSPEQCTATEADNRADIYALGCIMYECLSGAPPYTGQHSVAVMAQHVQAAIPQLSVPPDMQYVLNRALAKQPEDRFQTAKELSDALAPLVGQTIAHNTEPLMTANASSKASGDVAVISKPLNRSTFNKQICIGVTIAIFGGILILTMFQGSVHNQAEQLAGLSSTDLHHRTMIAFDQHGPKEKIAMLSSAALSADKRDRLLTPLQKQHLLEKLSENTPESNFDLIAKCGMEVLEITEANKFSVDQSAYNAVGMLAAVAERDPNAHRLVNRKAAIAALTRVLVLPIKSKGDVPARNGVMARLVALYVTSGQGTLAEELFARHPIGKGRKDMNVAIFIAMAHNALQNGNLKAAQPYFARCNSKPFGSIFTLGELEAMKAISTYKNRDSAIEQEGLEFNPTTLRLLRAIRNDNAALARRLYEEIMAEPVQYNYFRDLAPFALNEYVKYVDADDPPSPTAIKMYERIGKFRERALKCQ